MPIWSQFVDLIELGLRIFADLTGSAGLSIILFTVVIKTLLLPLTIKSVRSASAMQELQPKIRELQKRYGKDRQRLSAETMKLYQEHGVNPMSGCLPMLLQMPIFIGLYYAVRNLSDAGNGTWGSGFLWIPNLADPDPIFVLPILAGVFQFIQMRMTRPAGQQKSNDPQQQMMMTMMNFMPLMVVIFGWQFAAAPVLYWVAQAIYSVIQQWFITGWGALLDWFPFLPDLPEHRRLGYQDPAERAARASQQGQNVGLFGLLNQRIQQRITQVEEERVQSESAQQGQRANRPRKKGTRNGRNGQAEQAEQAEQAKPAPRPDLVPRKSRSAKRKGSVEGD